MPNLRILHEHWRLLKDDELVETGDEIYRPNKEDWEPFAAGIRYNAATMLPVRRPEKPWFNPAPENRPIVPPGTRFVTIDSGTPLGPKRGLSKGEELAIACFVAGLHEKDPKKSAAALLELVDYVRTLEAQEVPRG